LHFADDSTANTDVLVGADGIRFRAVRKALFEIIGPGLMDPTKTRHYSYLSWSGTLVYRTILPVKLSKIYPNDVTLKDFMLFCGKGKQVVSFLLAQGTHINVVAFVSDERKAGTPFEKAVEFHMYLLKSSTGHIRTSNRLCRKSSRWALHAVNELSLITYNRVALISDTSHPMTPHFGAGAGQSTEDAFVLGRLLARPLITLSDVPAALKAYQNVRLPFARFKARGSERTGNMNMLQFCLPGYYDGTDRGNMREETEILKENIIDQWGWKGEGSAVSE
ncbi:hypothetical protein BDR04DRAFT_1175928, partial [Suillus decipiens]